MVLFTKSFEKRLKNMKENKLLFFDIDGTLIDATLGINDIPVSTIYALNQLRLHYHKVFIATGRCQCFIVDPVLSYPFDGFVTCNGAYVSYEGNCIMKHLISQKAIDAAINFALRYQTILYLESSQSIYITNGDKEGHVDFENKWEMKKSVQVRDFNKNDIEVYIGIMLVNNESQIEQLRVSLSEFFDIQQHPNQLSFDLTLKKVSKETGITKLVETLGYDMKDVFAFGDGNNDIEMISSVGYGIAMGNAVKPLKEVAFDITSSINQDGIKNALIKYQLIEENICTK